MNYYLAVLKKYADFNGRARRSEYWYFFLFNVLFSIAALILDGVFKMGLINIAYSLAVLIPGIAVGVRRMHDVGKSGWYILIPIYNLVLACTEGTPGTNEYGPDPKQPEGQEEIQSIGAELHAAK